MDEQRLRVVSYNTHQCVGGDGRRDAGRVAAVLNEIEADVVGLQEVDAQTGLGHDSVQMDFLAAKLGMTAIAGPTIVRHDGSYGNALLTRRPVLAVRLVDLTVYRREPRGAIDADLDVDGLLVRVIVTHLGLLSAERRWQVRRLVQLLGEDPGRPAVLIGDINEWWAPGRPVRWLDACLGRRPTAATFPSRRPLFALDRVWARPAGALVEARAHASPLARAASDHLPLVADIRLPRAGAPVAGEGGPA